MFPNFNLGFIQKLRGPKIDNFSFNHSPIALDQMIFEWSRMFLLWSTKSFFHNSNRNFTAQKIFSFYAEKLCLAEDIKTYSYVSQAELTIDGVDDKEEMKLTDVRVKARDLKFWGWKFEVLTSVKGMIRSLQMWWLRSNDSPLLCRLDLLHLL